MTLSPGHLSIIILIHWSKVKKYELFFQEAQLFWVRSSSGAKALRPCRSDQTDQQIPQMFQLMCSRHILPFHRHRHLIQIQLMCSRYSLNIWAVCLSKRSVYLSGRRSRTRWSSVLEKMNVIHYCPLRSSIVTGESIYIQHITRRFILCFILKHHLKYHQRHSEYFRWYTKSYLWIPITYLTK